MRSRTIKPSFWDNEQLAECQPLSRLLFIGLWGIADRDGRLEDRPARIKKILLAWDDCNVEMLLLELVERGFIIRYDVGGQKLIQVTNFVKHQRPHPREESQGLPAPEDAEQSREAVKLSGPAAKIPGEAGKIPGSSKGETEGKGKGKQKEKPGFDILEKVRFPEPLDTPGCREAVADWLEYKHDRREAYKSPRHLSDLMQTFVRDGPEAFIAAVRWSMGCNYAGIFREKVTHGKPNTERRPQYAAAFDQARRDIARATGREVDP